jgi:hypothetical protein
MSFYGTFYSTFYGSFYGSSSGSTDLSEVLALLEAMQDQLDAIEAQTALISDPGTVFAGSAVASNGTISEIIIGDTYLAANDRAFHWTVPAPTGLALIDCTCRFGGEASGNHTGSWEVTGTITDAGSGNWKISFDLDESNTIDCQPGLYMWSAAIHGPAGQKITKVKSRTHKVQLVSKQTG